MTHQGQAVLARRGSVPPAPGGGGGEEGEVVNAVAVFVVVLVSRNE